MKDEPFSLRAACVASSADDGRTQEVCTITHSPSHRHRCDGTVSQCEHALELSCSFAFTSALRERAKPNACGLARHRMFPSSFVAAGVPTLTGWVRLYKPPLHLPSRPTPATVAPGERRSVGQCSAVQGWVVGGESLGLGAGDE